MSDEQRIALLEEAIKLAYQVTENLKARIEELEIQVINLGGYSNAMREVEK